MRGPFGDREVRQEMAGSGPVPVLLAVGGVDDVAGPDLERRRVTSLDDAPTLGDIEGLATLVRAPSGRAPGVKCTDAMFRREGGSPGEIGSIQTSPVNYSAGPLLVCCLGRRSMLGLLVRVESDKGADLPTESTTVGGAGLSPLGERGEP